MLRLLAKARNDGQVSGVYVKPDFSKGAEKASAVILSLSGKVLTEREKSFFKEADPLGFILFGRNIENPQQLKALCAEIKETVGRDCPILIDQEGGRVQRMGPPHWSKYTPMREFGEKAEADLDAGLEALRYHALRMADDLKAAGINVNCTPVLDILVEGAHDIIGDRAFSADPALCGRLGTSLCRHYLAAGIVPIIKHIPGHGRARSDSHLELPRIGEALAVLERTDFEPFCIVSKSDIGSDVWAMTAHIVYDAVDGDLPITLSASGIEKVIRQGIGFDGILISDDLDMRALDGYGTIEERAAAVIEAGCDLALYCWADMKIMEKIAESVPKIGEKALERLRLRA